MQSAHLQEFLSRAQSLVASGERDQAVALLRTILSSNPLHAAANNLAGFIALQQGQLEDAAAYLRRAAQAEPDNAIYRDNLALALAMQRNPNAESLHDALVTNPRQPGLWHELAQVDAKARHFGSAAAVLYEGLSHCPEHPDLLHALGNYLHQAGQIAQSVTHYLHCVRIAPEREQAHIDLSLAYQRLLRADSAESAARAAVACAPDSARAALNLGSVLYQRNNFDEARAHFERARDLAPADARVYNNLGMLYSALGDSALALASYRRSIQLDPDYYNARTNLMLALLYSDEVSGREIYREACAFGKHLAAPAEIAYTNSRNPERPLRVGFVSGDFRRHVVGLFLLPLFARRDRSRSTYFCYSLIDTPDPFTARLRNQVDQWVDIRALDNAQLAARVRADQIDILIDLSGHTSDSRLPAFAQCPAPVQATWLGFPGTTGAPGMQYRLTDDVLDPPGTEDLSTETPVRLASGFFCYQPPVEWGGELQVGSPPAARNGYITFGAFNNLAKLSAPCFDCWADILRETPGSILISRAKPFAVTTECARFTRQFTARGIEANRIKPLPYLPDPARHLEVYHEVDIHLDSLPYTGGTTTCDALWMGVPVVTLCGDRPSARLGATVLARIGLTELIATDHHDYVRIATVLARDRAHLAALRHGMRARLVASPLYDARSFADSFDSACRDMWGAWSK